jgi:cysteine desulfurase
LHTDFYIFVTSFLLKNICYLTLSLPNNIFNPMQRIYLDNAATTALDPRALEVMMPYLTQHFGNPSSIYSYGRETRMAVESARKTVARELGVQPSEIFFTSGGTESTNTAIAAAVRDLECTQIITSPIEHHATLHCAEHTCNCNNIQLSYVALDEKGHIKLDNLEALLSSHQGRSLVTLMHANNEIGNLLKVKAVGELCEQYNAIFHCDMVPTVGHFKINLSELPVHFISSAGHKFHGPKGIGVLYVNQDIQIKPYIQGGAQERNMRAGTENVYGIVGYAKALEIAMETYEEDVAYVTNLRNYMIEQLQQHIPHIGFNGDWDGSCIYTILSIALPKTEKSEMLLYSLDMNGVCVSGGSACSSGANHGSHVIAQVNNDPNSVALRFSFSKHNTKEEIDIVVTKMKELI